LWGTWAFLSRRRQGFEFSTETYYKDRLALFVEFLDFEDHRVKLLRVRAINHV